MTPAQTTAAVAGWLAQVRKLLVTLVTLAGALLALGCLPDDVAGWVSAGVSILGSVGVYATRNAPGKAASFAAPALDEVTGHGSVAMSAGAPRYEGRHEA